MLVLGGTLEARLLSARLCAHGELSVTTSLAGVVLDSPPPPGRVRTGGFGGVEGLVSYLLQERFGVVVDATHPFAQQITATAAQAAAQLRIPLLVLRRPGWTPQVGDDWVWVRSMAAAAATVALAPPGRVLLTAGRRAVSSFAGDATHHYIVRSINPPVGPLPPSMTLVLDRGPFTIETEHTLMVEHAVTMLVTKDSGGSMTAAKVAAARSLGVSVVIVARPPVPSGVPAVTTVEDAERWVASHIRYA